MKARYLKLKSWLLISAMGALGLGSSCSSHKQIASPEEPEQPRARERDEIRLMYGVPTMDYRIQGQVRNTQGKPVEGIKINMLEHGIEATPDTVYGDPENVRKYLEETSVTTDKNGHYEVRGSGVPREEVRVLVRDVDGARNGQYSNQLIEVKVEAADVDRTNAEGWNQGVFNKEVNIDLKQK